MLSILDAEKPKYSINESFDGYLADAVNDPHLASVRADLALARKLAGELAESAPVAAANVLKVVSRLALQVRDAEEKSRVFLHRDEVNAMLDRVAGAIAAVLRGDPQTVDLVNSAIVDAIRDR